MQSRVSDPYCWISVLMSSYQCSCLVGFAVVPETPHESKNEEYPPDHPKAKADTSKYCRMRYFMADVTNEEIQNSASQWW